MGEITALEIRGDKARNEQIIRSDYNEENRYSKQNGDMIGIFKEGDKRSIGNENDTGHGDWLPDANAPVNEFNYSNFNTDPNSDTGTMVDQKARNKAMVKSLYNQTNPYGDVVITPREGQYFVP